jgi:hypothetical protein
MNRYRVGFNVCVSKGFAEMLVEAETLREAEDRVRRIVADYYRKPDAMFSDHFADIGDVEFVPEDNALDEPVNVYSGYDEF